MRRALTALALLLGMPAAAIACIWDRDTPVDEARGLPEVVAVLTGRFERNPPLFYEMRLERVTAHLQSHPEDLAAYDDAGVACDRLGRGDEAISWMERKRAQLDGLDTSRPEAKEALYRYHANLGTFLAHRWVRQRADRSRIGEMKAARDEIARAIEINPNAHYGREKYQLRVLERIIEPPPSAGGQNLPDLLGWSLEDIYQQKVNPRDADDAVRGLAGLVVLGNAWESVDIFHSLGLALQADSLGFGKNREGGRNTLAYLAWLRCRELIDAGKGSMLPLVPKGDALKTIIRKPFYVWTEKVLDAAYPELRAEADAWQAARTAFMTARLKEGRHPDTDPDFWDGYTERPAPGLPSTSDREPRTPWRTVREAMVLLAALGVPTLLVVWLVGRSVRARRRKVKPTDDWSADAAS
jgi:tetratricopeptide (TPR) repeat protein